MRQIKNPFILVVAIIAVGVLVYFVWHSYEQRTEDEQARARMAAPPQVPGMSQLYKDAPPPPQP
jgi:cytochrome c-type biogenesis protein CcmH/NrfG